MATTSWPCEPADKHVAWQARMQFGERQRGQVEADLADNAESLKSLLTLPRKPPGKRSGATSIRRSYAGSRRPVPGSAQGMGEFMGALFAQGSVRLDRVSNTAYVFIDPGHSIHCGIPTGRPTAGDPHARCSGLCIMGIHLDRMTQCSFCRTGVQAGYRVNTAYRRSTFHFSGIVEAAVDLRQWPGRLGSTPQAADGRRRMVDVGQ